MNFTFKIFGIGGCASKAQSAFLKHTDVLSAEVSHQEGTAKVKADRKPDRSHLDKLLADAGEYRITEVAENSTSTKESHSHASAMPEQETASTYTLCC